MEVKSVPFGWTTVYGNSHVGAGVLMPLTGWLDCAKFDSARATVELRGSSHEDYEVRIGLEFADYPDQATMPTIWLTGYIADEGITYPTAWVSISSETDGNQLVRVVAQGRLKDDTPGTFQAGRVSGRVDLRTC